MAEAGSRMPMVPLPAGAPPARTRHDRDRARHLTGSVSVPSSLLTQCDRPSQYHNFAKLQGVEATPTGPATVVEIPQLISSVEAAALVREFDAAGFHSLRDVYPPEHRSNDRLLVYNPTFAALMWRRIRPYISMHQFRHIQPQAPRVGQWKPYGLNDVAKVARYGVGAEFKEHRDGSWQPRADRASVFTVIVYLNAGYRGGETSFRRQGGGNVTFQARRAGDALFFQHDLLHAGLPVTEGTKYIVRFDVMYENVAPELCYARPQREPALPWPPDAAPPGGDGCTRRQWEALSREYDSALRLRTQHSAGDTDGLRRFTEAHLGAVEAQARMYPSVVQDLGCLLKGRLPYDCLARALRWLPLLEVVPLGRTCRAFFEACRDGDLWRPLYEARWGDSLPTALLDDRGDAATHTNHWYGWYRDRHRIETRAPAVVLEHTPGAVRCAFTLPSPAVCLQGVAPAVKRARLYQPERYEEDDDSKYANVELVPPQVDWRCVVGAGAARDPAAERIYEGPHLARTELLPVLWHYFYEALGLSARSSRFPVVLPEPAWPRWGDGVKAELLRAAFDDFGAPAARFADAAALAAVGAGVRDAVVAFPDHYAVVRGLRVVRAEATDPGAAAAAASCADAAAAVAEFAAQTGAPAGGAEERRLVDDRFPGRGHAMYASGDAGFPADDISAHDLRINAEWSGVPAPRVDPRAAADWPRAGAGWRAEGAAPGAVPESGLPVLLVGAAAAPEGCGLAGVRVLNPETAVLRGAAACCGICGFFDDAEWRSAREQERYAVSGLSQLLHGCADTAPLPPGGCRAAWTERACYDAHPWLRGRLLEQSDPKWTVELAHAPEGSYQYDATWPCGAHVAGLQRVSGAGVSSQGWGHDVPQALWQLARRAPARDTADVAAPPLPQRYHIVTAGISAALVAAAAAAVAVREPWCCNRCARRGPRATCDECSDNRRKIDAEASRRAAAVVHTSPMARAVTEPCRAGQSSAYTTVVAEQLQRKQVRREQATEESGVPGRATTCPAGGYTGPTTGPPVRAAASRAAAHPAYGGGTFLTPADPPLQPPRPTPAGQPRTSSGFIPTPAVPSLPMSGQPAAARPDTGARAREKSEKWRQQRQPTEPTRLTRLTPSLLGGTPGARSPAVPGARSPPAERPLLPAGGGAAGRPRSPPLSRGQPNAPPPSRAQRGRSGSLAGSPAGSAGPARNLHHPGYSAPAAAAAAGAAVARRSSPKPAATGPRSRTGPKH